MKHIKTAIVAAMMPLTFNALALTITNEAGNLSSYSIDNLNVSNLTITGSLNAADFNYITDNITKLDNVKTLDLSGATVEAYSGNRVLTGGTEYAANVLPPYALMSLKADNVVLPAGITEIGESALANSSISSLTIPASVTAIDSYAFAGCDNLTTVTVPSTVTVLGDGLFMNCSALRTAEIFSQVDEISSRMFDGCTSLTDVSIQNVVTSIADQAFENCSSLATFTFPRALQTIGKQAFYGAGLTGVSLQGCSSLQSVGDYAFAKCGNLVNVDLGDHSLTLGEGVFFDDTALNNVVLPASTTLIPDFTFKGTTSINPATALPDNVKEIGAYALTGWSDISEFTFPTSIEKIGDYAFADWTLASSDPDNVLFHAEKLEIVPKLGENVFDGMGDKAATLKVKDEDMSAAYEAEPQFDTHFFIKAATTTIIDNIIDNNTSSVIDFSFDGSNLVITSSGEDIASVTIYDLEGKRIYAKQSRGKSVTVDTSAWPRLVIVANVTLADNTRAAIKLTRN